MVCLGWNFHSSSSYNSGFNVSFSSLAFSHSRQPIADWRVRSNSLAYLLTSLSRSSLNSLMDSFSLIIHHLTSGTSNSLRCCFFVFMVRSWLGIGLSCLDPCVFEMAVIAWLSHRCCNTADITGILVPCCHATLFISVPHSARMADPYWICWYFLFHSSFGVRDWRACSTIS